MKSGDRFVNYHNKRIAESAVEVQDDGTLMEVRKGNKLLEKEDPRNKYKTVEEWRAILLESGTLGKIIYEPQALWEHIGIRIMKSLKPSIQVIIQ
jgi:hypothetical protein